ncbi:hypothetical protein NM688_g1894 [Phlebia brevispora]|uniref:Uncharacterized protein n=1 Tax=Phlebia brevispora TaxID=194682 RepID=A0ACC1TAB4_9APHY|nr:hypothetical protein NM688_g1894 [Phlebia brevispora]
MTRATIARIVRMKAINCAKIAGIRRSFSVASILNANRAITYRSPGDPASILTALTYPSLPPPAPHSVNVRFILSPVNPADINVVEGVYPSKPSPDQSLIGTTLFVGGNEGLAEVTEIGSEVIGLQKGDRVVMGGQQLGTWASARTLLAEDVVKVPEEISEVGGATITVNPPTAYNMIHDFVDLKEGDWLVQNGANSAVGQMVIQIAARKGLKTLNFVRSRDDLESLKRHLTNLGATQILTYDDLQDKTLREKVKEWTAGKPIRLMLNCVGGRDTTAMTRFLGEDAHLVSYGAMSKQPLSLPTSAFIFKNLTCHGFWQSRWYKQRTREEREGLFKRLAAMKLQEPEHEILTIPADINDDAATERVRDAVRKLGQGQHGKKVLLKIEQLAE